MAPGIDSRVTSSGAPGVRIPETEFFLARRKYFVFLFFDFSYNFGPTVKSGTFPLEALAISEARGLTEIKS